MIGITFGSDILETPPSFRMSAGTRSRAMTAQAWKKVTIENHRNLQFKKPGI